MSLPPASSRCHVPGPFVLLTVAVLSAERYHPRRHPFHRQRSLNFPLPPTSIHFASISTFTPRCVFFAQGCYLSFCPHVSTRSRHQNATVRIAPPLFSGKTWKMALLTTELFLETCSRVETTLLLTHVEALLDAVWFSNGAIMWSMIVEMIVFFIETNR